MTLLKATDRIENYSIVNRISSHHSGLREVYEAAVIDHAEKKVAITAFDFEKANRSGEIEEIKYYSSLKGDMFAPVSGCGETFSAEGRRIVWMATEWAEGTQLSKIMDSTASSGLNIQVAYRIMELLLEGIAEISRATDGGGHYNITPDNIIVELTQDQTEVKFLHITGTAYMGQSWQGAAPFTNGGLNRLYRAPETFQGIFNSQSDIYSAGIIMGLLLSGQYPLNLIEDPKSDNTTFRKKLNEALQSFSHLRGKLSRGQIFALIRATNQKKIIRYEKAYKFMRDLCKLQGGKQSYTGCAKPDLIDRTSATTSSDVPNTACHGGGFKDVAGMAPLKRRIKRDFIDLLRNADLAKMYGINPPNGLLLYGAPGCGKTFIAVKTAEEAGINYQIINPSTLGSTYIHGTQEKIAETFEMARKKAPIILIFDEFDALAPIRNGNTHYQANEVNELLTQLNNCSERGIYVIAMTNRPDMIDSAVLRRGRIDAKIFISLPDEEARREQFELELRHTLCDDDIDTIALAKATDRFICSDVSYVVCM